MDSASETRSGRAPRRTAARRKRFDAARVRRDFPALAGDLVFLNSASMGAVSTPALRAIEEQTRLLAEGPAKLGWNRFIERFEAGVDRAREEAARLLGARRDEVGLIGDTTSGLHQAIDAIPFAEGDNVVLSDLEYPQVALAAQNARRERGVEVRFVRHRDGRVTADDYRAAVDRRTRAILVSSVGWVTGERVDLAALSNLAEERDLFLVVDAVQQLGGVSLDCAKLRIDFLTAGGYKWLNAPFGCGLFYARSAAHERGIHVRRVGLLGLEEPEGGWGSFYGSPTMKPLPDLSPTATVRRFEAQGTHDRLGAAGLAAALAHRNAQGRREIDRHVLELTGTLIDELAGRGAKIWTPRAAPRRAGIVCFTFGGGPAADIALQQKLEAERIFVGARYCSGVGGVRVAVHLFNTRRDVRALLAAIDRLR